MVRAVGKAKGSRPARRLFRRGGGPIIPPMSKSFDERFVSHELIFDGKVAKGYVVEVRMDDGRVVRRDYFHYGGAAVILPVPDDGSIVLISNYRFAVDEHLLELPAGMLEAGEDPALYWLRDDEQ